MTRDPVSGSVCGWGRCAKPLERGEKLCRIHLVRAWMDIETERTTFGLTRAQIMQECFESRESRQSVLPKIPVNRSESRVYYLRLPHGDIKIGYTGDLRSRVSSLRATLDDVMASEPGGRELEQLRHGQFEHLRRQKRREDFAPADDLLSHIHMVTVRFGDFDPHPVPPTREQLAARDALIDAYDAAQHAGRTA